MGWVCTICLLVVLQYTSRSCGAPHNLQIEEHLSDNMLSTDDDNSVSEPVLQSEQDKTLLELGDYLAYILTTPWPKTGVPLLYIEEYNDLSEADANENLQDVFRGLEDESPESRRPVPFKRSRYYRKYPWKRQNSRETYEAENRYLCQPSKDDVFRLLVALHEARQGNRGRTINFCNRKRPASAIFTNIRFLGKRK